MKRIAAMIISAFIIIINLAACTKPFDKLSAAELLDLGEKYLLETDYEQAVVHFNRLIEVEPMNPRGYTGAAEAYVGLGQIDKADEILRQGLKLLPDETFIRGMLDQLTAAPSQSESSSSGVPLWDSLTDGERSMLERLDYAAEAFDYEAAYEVMASTEFSEIYSRLGINIGENIGKLLKIDENYQWGLIYSEDSENKSYSWSKNNPGKLSIDCDFHPRESSFIISRSESSIDENKNVRLNKYIVYEPESERLIHNESTIVDELGRISISTDMITGEKEIIQWEYDESGRCIRTEIVNNMFPEKTQTFQHEYDENGREIRYLLDKNGKTYVKIEDGEFSYID